MPDFKSMREHLDDMFNPYASVVSNEELTQHMYTCSKCGSWSYSKEEVKLDFFSCIQCGYETSKVHHVVLKKRETA